MKFSSRQDTDLPADQLFQSGKALCGFLNGAWLPGRLLKSGNFASFKESRRDALRRALKAAGAQQLILLAQADAFGKKHKKQRGTCAAGPGNREWTVLVYMAADNNLAISGILDIDEMEAGGGSSAAVQVVVQGEFNPDELAQYGLTDPSYFNRPN